jgi:hypothetical protein
MKPKAGHTSPAGSILPACLATLLAILQLSLASCSLTPGDEEIRDATAACSAAETAARDATIDDAETFYDWLHDNQMEPLYDGPAAGTWGETLFGYKLVLRDIYWKIDSYGRMGTTPNPRIATFSARSQEGVNYLKQVQDDGGNGCWGIPDEPSMPEFGPAIQQVEALDAADPSQYYIVNGWIVNLPAADISALYYDHGRSLTALCRHYLRTHDAALTGYITRGADWCLDKPGTDNVNYNSSIIEGLAYAYQVTGTTGYLDRAKYLTEHFVIPTRNADGSYYDSHNRMLRYHGFIISGLLALRNALPSGDPMIQTVDDHIRTSRKYLLSRLHDCSRLFDEDSIGICLRVYAEIADCADAGNGDPLTGHENEKIKFLIQKCIDAQSSISRESNNYYRQKALWHFCQIGVAIAKFKYGK